MAAEQERRDMRWKIIGLLFDCMAGRAALQVKRYSIGLHRFELVIYK